MNIETANRLLQYRKQHNLSQEGLAEKIGVSRQAISKWERAEASPDTDNLILLAKIYGVSLDTLLKGEDNPDDSNAETETADNAQSSENNDSQGNNDSAKKEGQYEKINKVSFKNGIHIDSDEGDHIHLDFVNGIHVHDKDGTNVDIGKDGVFVEEKGKQHVYTDENGNVMADEEVRKHHSQHKKHNAFNKFPFFILPIIAFFAWGISGVCLGWGLSWIVFLTIPLYYSLGDAIYKRNPNHFAFPVLAAMAYILFGFFGICGGWSMGWLVFLTIPIYYWICEIIKPKDDKCDSDCDCNCNDCH